MRLASGGEWKSVKQHYLQNESVRSGKLPSSPTVQLTHPQPKESMQQSQMTQVAL